MVETATQKTEGVMPISGMRLDQHQRPALSESRKNVLDTLVGIDQSLQLLLSQEFT